MLVDGNDYKTSSVTKGLARHRHAQQQPKGEGEQPQSGGKSMHDHQGQEGGHEQIQQVHDEHGPAQKAEVKHDGTTHAVTTTHGEHVHESKGHPTVEHVHAHLGHAVGAGGSEQHGEPDGDEGGSSLEAMGVGGPAGE